MIGCIILQLPIAFILAFWLSTSKLRYTKFFRSVYFFPVAISGVAVGLIWQFLYQPKLGIVDEVVRLLGFHSFQFAWLANRSAAIWAVVIAVSWQYFGYHLLIFTAPKWTSTPSSLAKHMQRQGTGAATALSPLSQVVCPAGAWPRLGLPVAVRQTRAREV